MTRTAGSPYLWGPLLLLILIAVTRPWVAVPLDADGHAVVGPAKVDLATVAGSAWTQKLPSAIQAAAPVSAAKDKAQLLKGEGVVEAIDSHSRVGIAIVDLAAPGAMKKVRLQIGPVIFDNALRDALGLRFADFDTQIDYAKVGRLLNARALASLPVLEQPKQLVGHKVAFVGAGGLDDDGQVELMPVQLTVQP